MDNPVLTTEVDNLRTSMFVCTQPHVMEPTHLFAILLRVAFLSKQPVENPKWRKIVVCSGGSVRITGRAAEEEDAHTLLTRMSWPPSSPSLEQEHSFKWATRTSHHTHARDDKLLVRRE